MHLLVLIVRNCALIVAGFVEGRCWLLLMLLLFAFFLFLLFLSFFHFFLFAFALSSFIQVCCQLRATLLIIKLVVLGSRVAELIRFLIRFVIEPLFTLLILFPVSLALFGSCLLFFRSAQVEYPQVLI